MKLKNSNNEYFLKKRKNIVICFLSSFIDYDF